MTHQDVMTVVKPVILNQLKCPASAQFSDNLISIVGNDENGYQVSGFVDSQNSYGAMIRTKFTATVSVENNLPFVTSSAVGAATDPQQAKLERRWHICYVIIGICAVIYIVTKVSLFLLFEL